LRELWAARELVLTLAERELRARYKQAVLGFAWAVLTPLALMVAFSTFLQRTAHFDTRGTPYSLFALLGLIPWAFFSTSVSVGGQSVVSNASLLNKVYSPREVFPLASVLVAAIDMAVSSVTLLALFAIAQFAPKGTGVWIPLALAVQFAFTVGVTLVVSSTLVYLRDLRHLVPVVLQLGLFCTPVAYGMDVVPAHLRTAYALLNPLGPVIDTYRRAMLYGERPDWSLMLPGALSAVVVLGVGYWLFKLLEGRFADVA